jgi:hypothetical protein
VTNASGVNVTNIYNGVGSYTVSLTVAGPGGANTAPGQPVTVKARVALGKPVLSGGQLILGGTNGPAGQPRFALRQWLSHCAAFVVGRRSQIIRAGFWLHVLSLILLDLADMAA